MTVIGIPRSLLYYNYYPAWKCFFEELGAEIILSDKTTKNILDSGVKVAVDETCLPVKLFFGHVQNLKEKKIDYMFIPRVVSVEKKRYLCPKFLGLPNMVTNLIKDLPPILHLDIDLSKKSKGYYREIYDVGKLFSSNPVKIALAYKKSIKKLQEYQKQLLFGVTPMECLQSLEEMGEYPQDGKIVEDGEKSGFGRVTNTLKIAVLGHSYNLNDSYISMDIFKKLQGMGVEILTTEMLSHSAQSSGASKLRKDMFWTFGKEIIGSAYYLLNKGIVDGVVLVVSFGCGPDSLVGELIERIYKRERTLPLLFLTLDEHSGEAGVLTRLEAFIDMIRLNKKSAVG
ncbi:acyl-CoA dehydratase activase-related protein [Candidatus Contubernalis alkaliaceticus]|uniref:acyl-CoA dehydratase activase-related protein n=1 Tax=Candidatus Contubernalis alkaliaceticus TaxID=338645 RepID=UPI001F4C11EE|nr:acyl-CoA dehydratase activase-related protein [Candidatus Contubernalis alkalaceticus]UNC92515.1 hypothetical protein HUE98_10655 [Candidatus Contubernalis alkalaceticus]